MTDINQSSWSETDSSNNSAAPDGWKSGVMLPSDVEPTGRMMMGAVKRWYDRAQPTVTSAGTGNAQTLTYTVAPAALVAGDEFAFIIGAGLTNTGAMTLDVGVGGALAVQLDGAALTGAEFVAGAYARVRYDGTQFQIVQAGTARARENPTTQYLTSGSSATYTTPTGCRQLQVWVKGAGGGGAGSASSGSGGIGSSGGVSEFNGIAAAGGTRGTGTANDGLGGAGGSGGPGTATWRTPGAPGCPSSFGASGLAGGSGGGRGGGVGQAGDGNAGVANSGGGGAGAQTVAASLTGGGGGGEGEEFFLVINSPAATYTYTVGAGGAGGSAGTGGNAGGAGGSGYVRVVELY